MRGCRKSVLFNMVSPLARDRLSSARRRRKHPSLDRGDSRSEDAHCIQGGMSTMTKLTRRDFIHYTAMTVPAVALAPQLAAWQGGDPWQRADEIVRRIIVPKFPARHFDITKYGAVGDGKASCTDAIRKAIAACAAAGGGQVVVPDGRFLTGAIRLESNVNLHLADKATLAFSDDVKQYPIVFTRWEGVELMNF